MKIRYLFFLLFLIETSFAQTYLIKGRVVDEKGTPLKDAVVYINNTTFGVFTDKNGNYELEASKGTHTVIASFLGFETAQEQLEVSKKVSTLFFVLHPKTNVLDEVIIKKVVYDKKWYANLAVFKRNFLGNTFLSKTCKILNPRVLSFDFNPKTGVLRAFARKPLQIKNQGLGYLITYDLVDFTLTKTKISYIGYTQYQLLKGGKRKQKRWQKNRLKAYKGSQMHFVRSLRSKKLDTAGFLVHQFKRVANKKRPTDAQITKARSFVRNYMKQTRKPLNFHQKITNPTTTLDSSLVMIQKAKLSKYIDYLYRKNVPYEAMIQEIGAKILLEFKDYLLVIYTKAPPEKNYKYFSQQSFKGSDSQTSTIQLLTKNAVLDPSGDIINPLDVFVEGYWSYKQFADLLPLNYMPRKED